MKKQLAVVLPFLVLGCNQAMDADNDGIVDGVREPDSVTVVAPASPKGTVSGQVLTTRMTPLAGASVVMTIGSAGAEAPKVETDASGNFMFKNVPAGSGVLLTITKDGYATMRTNATVPSSAGNIPINNGNASVGAIGLAEVSGTLRFALVTPTGRPAVGAQAFLEASPAGFISLNGSSKNYTGTVAVSAQADAQGVVTFTGVPSAAEVARIGSGGFNLWVEPLDVNADGIPDTGGYSNWFDAGDLMSYGTTQLLQLPQVRNSSGSGGSLTIQATNVATLVNTNTKDPLRNMVRAGEALYVAFNHPVQKDSLVATVTDEFGREGFPLTATANATGDIYTLGLPSQLLIREGQEYNVLLRATSALDGSTLSRTGYFISGDARTPKSTTTGFVTVEFMDGVGGAQNNVLDNNECVLVTFNQAIVPPSSGTVEVFFDTVIGYTNNYGEYAGDNGFPLSPAAPPLVSTCFNDPAVSYPINTGSFTYTPRFFFQFTTPTSQMLAAGTKVKLGFGKQQTLGNAAYETAWATPITKDIEVSLARRQ